METVKAFFYIKESYQDPMHMMGYIRYENYFVPDYKLIITMKDKKITVVEAESPDIVYSHDTRHCIKAKLIEVMVDKSFIGKCLKLLEQQKILTKLENDLSKGLPDNKTVYDPFFQAYEKGYSAYNGAYKTKDYKDAIKYLTQALEYNDSYPIIYYLLASCYENLDQNKSVEYIKKAIEYGSNNLLGFVSNHKSLEHHPEIKKMLEIDDELYRN